MNERKVFVAGSSKTGIRAFLAGIVGMLAPPENNQGPMLPSLERMVGRHHPGPVGRGHSSRKRTSQRERSNRRSAKRSAKARRT